MDNLSFGPRGEGENVWGHTMWPLAEAAGPPLVQSQTLTHLPQTGSSRLTAALMGKVLRPVVRRLFSIVPHVFRDAWRKSLVPSAMRQT